MASPKLNFNRTTVVDPTSGAIHSLTAAQNTLSDWQRNNLAQEQLANQAKQQAFANDLATQQAAIQKAQEGRLASEYGVKLNDRNAITNSMQNNLLNPDVAKYTADVYDRIDKSYQDKYVTNADGTTTAVIDPRKLALYEKANAALMPGGELRSEYTKPLDVRAYTQRVMNDMGNATPEAKSAALELIKKQYPAADNDAFNTAAAKVFERDAAARNKLFTDAGITTTVTGGEGGGGSTSSNAGTGNSYVDVTDKLITTGGIGENWNLNSTDASQLKDMTAKIQKSGGNITVGDKTVHLSKNEWSAAIKNAMDSKDGNWIFTEGLDSDKFKQYLVDFAGTAPDKGGRNGSSGSDKVTTKSINKSALSAIAENTATEMANLRKQFNMGSTTKESAQGAVDRIFKGIFDADKPVNDKNKSTANVNTTIAPTSDFDKKSAMFSALNSTDSSKSIKELAAAEPDVFVKEYNDLNTPQKNKIDEIIKGNPEAVSNAGGRGYRPGFSVANETIFDTGYKPKPNRKAGGHSAGVTRKPQSVAPSPSADVQAELRAQYPTASAAELSAMYESLTAPVSNRLSTSPNAVWRNR